MAQVINTNIASLNAQRNLNASQGQLNISLERLSSGLRINSAKDDAAGLAISERFTSQINGLDQAARNSNDGISYAQTAEGALDEAGNLLQRVRELAVQSANDTNSASDREALDQEVQQAIDEIGRIARDTQFNDQNILDGTLRDLFFQVGANQGQTIAVSGVDARSTELGRALVQGEEGLTQDDIAEGIESVGEITIALGEGDDAIPIELGDDELGEVTSLEDLVREINSAITNFAGEGDDAADQVQAVRNAGLSAAVSTNDAGESTVVVRGAFDSDFSVEGGEITLADGEDTTVELFGDGEDAVNKNLTEIDVATRGGANETIAVVDGALEQVSGIRADLGAVQNRFEATVANLSITSENLSASRSRIMDADFASETAALTRGQILQQAGTSVLSQANQIPNNVLNLLQ
ncbi:flagellin [Alkalispirillum mobile]|uniref:Flagellin n=1 Tax=Alkalispirillum mobile TaxID=85925 RepID=A0A498C5D2_9GAMM|nr:flagellin [Alkalispirillum mobile]RLK51025.1 flagellin [Alkalispirillum mobile]